MLPHREALKQLGFQDNDIDAYLAKKQVSSIAPTEETPTNHNPAFGATRSASTLMRKLGLGMIPDLAGNFYTLANHNTIDESNPFTSVDEYRKIAQEGNMGIAKNVGRDAAGLASWLLPWAKIARIPGVSNLVAGRAVNAVLPGTVQGTLQGLSQEDATPQSVATNALLAGPVTQLLAKLAHPIMPFTNWSNEAAKSGGNVDVGDVVDNLQTGEIPKNLRKFPVADLNKATDEFANIDLPDRVQRFRSQAPSAGIGDMVLPAEQANELKKELYDLVYNLRGNREKDAFTGVAKEGSRLLKDQIEQAAPGVKLPNRIASKFYSIPDFAGDVTGILPYPARRVANAVGGLPFKLAQKAIPYEGAGIQRLLPTLYNLMQ